MVSSEIDYKKENWPDDIDDVCNKQRCLKHKEKKLVNLI